MKLQDMTEDVKIAVIYSRRDHNHNNHLYHVEVQRKERDTYLTLVCRCT